MASYQKRERNYYYTYYFKGKAVINAVRVPSIPALNFSTVKKTLIIPYLNSKGISGYTDLTFERAKNAAGVTPVPAYTITRVININGVNYDMLTGSKIATATEKGMKLPYTNESFSVTSDVVKESFSAWLSGSMTKYPPANKYSPEVYLSCIDKISAYLIRRKISTVDLWQLTNFELFKDIYIKAANDKLFKTNHKTTHTVFVQVGLAFLKFLMSNPMFTNSSNKSLEINEQVYKRLTIKEAIINVLQSQQRGMTIAEIYSMIIEEGLYTFGALNPQNVVRIEIERACKNSGYTIHTSNNQCFIFERNQKGEKVYYLLSATPSDDNANSNVLINDKPSDLIEVISEPSNLEIWNDSIEQSFLSWMDFENLAPATIRNYCSALNRTVHNFKPLVDNAVNKSSTKLEAVRNFFALLNQDSGFIDANSTAHNLYSAAVSALCRFFEAYNQVPEESMQYSNLIRKEPMLNIAVYDWNTNPNINGTKPFSISLFNHNSVPVNSWKALLMYVYKYVTESFPHIDITKISRRNGRRKLCSYNPDEVSYAEKLDCGLYVDTAFSANDVVGIIQAIFELCGADIRNIAINYRQKGFGIPLITEIDNNTIKDLSEEEKNILEVLKYVFPYSMSLGFVDLCKLKSYYSSRFNASISLADDAVSSFIRKNAIKIDPTAERYTHLDNLTSPEVLDDIKKFIDNEIKNGIKRVYVKPIYDTFKDDLGIVVNEDLLLTIIETAFSDEYKINKKSMFISSKNDTLTQTIGDEISTAISRLLKENVMPFSIHDISNGLPAYPHNKIENVIFNGIDSVVAVGNFKYAHIDYVYISDGQIEQIKSLIAQGIEMSGYKDIEELFLEITKNISDIIDMNPDISKADIIKAINNKISGNYTALHGRFVPKKGAQ